MLQTVTDLKFPRCSVFTFGETLNKSYRTGISRQLDSVLYKYPLGGQGHATQ